MTKTMLAAATFALALGASSAAIAAPKAKATPTPEPPPPPSPWVAPTPAASTAATMESAATSSGPMVADHVTYRPEGKSIGIGAGWTFPQDLGTPNTFTVRLRREDGLTLEPGVQIDVLMDNSKVSGGGASASGSSSTINLILGTAIRKPFMSRNKVDIVGILTPAIAITSSSTKPAGGTKTTSTAFGLGTGWGVGVEYWPKTHWSISFNALNPLLAVGSTSTKDSGTGIKNDDTQIFVGADFNPSVQLLTHLYY